MGENELQAICFWPRFIIFHFEPARPNRSDKHISSNQQREKWKGGLLGSPNINSSSWFSIAEIQDSGTWAWSCTPPSLYLEQGKKKKPSRSIHICITLPFEFRGAMSPYILPILPPKALVYTPQYPFLLRTCICANVCVCVWLHVCVCTCGRWRWNSWKLICQILWQPFRRQNRRKKSINRRKRRRGVQRSSVHQANRI